MAGNWEIYAIDANGSRSERLTSDPTQEENPTWSRDGRWIYFRSDRSGIGQIWRMPASGGPAQPVTRGEGSQAFESLDGRTIYFVRADNSPGLWSMPVDGGVETFLSTDVREHWWSVTNAGIVFAVSAETPGGNRLLRFDPVSRRTLPLATLPDGQMWRGFSSAADGRAVWWPQTVGYQSHLMIIDEWRP